jgi:hypothetical protein
MRLASGLIAFAAGMLVVCVSAPVSAQTPQAVGHTVVVSTGSIEGFVQDETGAPVAGAVISASGAATVYGLTDRLGHFAFRSMPPGPYFVRAHIQGFVAPRGQMVQVLPSTRASSAIAVRRVGATSTTSAVIVPASLGGLPDVPSQKDKDADASPSSSSTRTSDAGDDNRKNGANDGEIEWRLRHARRSILKDAVDQVVAADAPPSGAHGAGDWSRPDAAVSSAAHVATSFFSETPFFGQVNLLTTSSFDAPLELFTTKAFASRGVANILLGAPVGDGADWTVRGALTQGDIASWLVFGDYVTRAPARHRYDVGLSYSTQRYDGGNFAALRNVTDGSRNVGTLHGFDTFAVSPALTVTYGTRFGHYDYLDGKNLLSPRAGLVFAAADHLRVNALVSLRSLAPGAEEFMPPADTGVWLPPQRTFSSAFDGPLVAERTLHVEGGVERDIAPGATVSVRAFSQRVDNQLVTLFGLEEPGQPPATLGHYFVANSGSVAATGYAAAVRAVFTQRVHGSVEYSFARADRNPADALAYFLFLGPFHPVRENIHDVSTSIETDLPETSTHVAVLCRMSDGFARRDMSSGSALDARFDVQVRQALPFMDFSSAKWEMLVAVRNFFHDPTAESSVYDELLVTRPPTRVVGGLTLRF